MRTTIPLVDSSELVLAAKKAAAQVISGRKTPSAAVAAQVKQGSYSREHAQRIVEFTNRELLSQHLAGAKTAAERKSAIQVARLPEVLRLTGDLPDPMARVAVEKAAAAAAVADFDVRVENPLEIIFGAEVVKAAEAEERKKVASSGAALMLREKMRAAHAALTSQLTSLEARTKEAASTLDSRVREARATGLPDEAILVATARVAEHPRIHQMWAQHALQCWAGQKLAGALQDWRMEEVRTEHPLILAYAVYEKLASLEQRVAGGRRVLAGKLRYRGAA